ncbi:MAG TPA: adenylate/guanylate cyclase domain-containing protein [Candidatus Tumulicola sp.]|nr:adenylate/guanylate cyclase domain-containing protein [Candidatus Tumulicola sp.]
MSLKEDITSEVNAILSQPWSIRDGIVVPENKDVNLVGGAVKLDAIMFYADLADSTALVMTKDRGVVAKVFKTFLSTAARLIKANSGYVRSFDGDRIMGVFLGGTKRTQAAKCGLHLNWAFCNVVKPRLLVAFPTLESGGFKLEYSTGIDVSDILVVRGGVYKDNDLLWVGRAANVAAKLSAIRQTPFRTFISKDVYDNMHESSRLGGTLKSNMWVPFLYPGVKGQISFYKSSWTWEP